MYIETNSLIIVNSLHRIPNLYIVKNGKPCCVLSKYMRNSSHKEDIYISTVKDMPKYYQAVNNIYTVNPSTAEFIQLFIFMRKNNWPGNFYILFDV